MGKPWNIKCCIISCLATADKYPDRRFFLFPKPGSDKYKKWIDICAESASEIEKKKKPYLCHIHFADMFLGKKFLKKNALPTLFLSFLPQHSSFAADSEALLAENNIKVYKRQSYSNIDDDLNFDELNKMSTLPMTRRSSSASPISCNVCLNSVKQVKAFRKSVVKVKKQNLNLTSKVRKLQTIGRKQRCYINRIKKMNAEMKEYTKDISKNIDSLSNVNGNSKTFSKMILQKPRVYSEEEKKLCQFLFYRSSAGYQFMRNILQFHLPHVASLHKWAKLKHLSPGIDFEILNEVKNQVMNMPLKDREVVLSFDEMSIEECLIYDNFSDVIVGYQDFGSNERSTDLAKSVMVFMVRSLCGKFKHVMHYVACSSSMKSEVLYNELMKCLNVCHMMDLNVRGITCDQGSLNRKLYKSLNVSEVNPMFFIQNREIHAMYDVPHLFKTLRNRLLISDICTPDGTISFDVIRFLYNYERDNVTKLCPKLTFYHINPTNFQKMSVKLALQVISHSVSSAILSLLALNKFSFELREKAKATATCFQKLNKLFDILNGKPAFTRSFINIEFLQEMEKYVLKMKPVKGTSFCFNGLSMTIKSIITITRSIFLKHDDVFYIYGQKFNQDCLENLFSQIRARNGNKSNPNLFEFNQLLGKVISVKIFYTSSFANCENDSDEYFDFDWSAVLNIPSSDKNIPPEIHDYGEGTSSSQENIFDGGNDHDETIHLRDEDEIFNFPENVQIGADEAAFKYFVGYCCFKIINRMKTPCENCLKDLTEGGNNDDMSNILIKTKSFSSINNGLTTPSNHFFNICKVHIKIFEDTFKNRPHIANIKKFIIEKCVISTENWFASNECYPHRMSILDFMLKVLLRKHCSWAVDQYRAKKKETKLSNTKNKKFKKYYV